MDAYTAEALIELGTELLKESEDYVTLHFMGDDLYDLANIDMDEVFKHFEDRDYICYILDDEMLLDDADGYTYESMKTLVITK